MNFIPPEFILMYSKENSKSGIFYSFTVKAGYTETDRHFVYSDTHLPVPTGEFLSKYDWI